MDLSGKFIAIEGLDGSGKSTQIDLLIRHFEAKKVPVRFIHFPRHNEGIFGKLISRFLRGEFGSLENVHPQLVALLFAEDRKDFGAVISQWLEEGALVLVDRYVLSNIAFQCAKLSVESERAQLTDWILDFEYNYNRIPKPDLSVYLQVPFDFTLRSLAARRQQAARDYLAGAHDIHEADMVFQRAVRSEYEKMTTTYPRIRTIHCGDEQGAMRQVEQIHNEILSALATL